MLSCYATHIEWHSALIEAGIDIQHPQHLYQRRRLNFVEGGNYGNPYGTFVIYLFLYTINGRKIRCMCVLLDKFPIIALSLY